MRLKACVTCGRPFPARPRVQHCSEHRAPVAAARASYQTPEWRAARAEALADAGGRCEIAACQTCRYRVAAHHVDPKAAGGSDLRVVVLCGPHHSQYEADVRYGRDTDVRREVDSLAASR